MLEGYGGRCGEVTLDNQETTQAEMDKVSVLMALRYTDFTVVAKIGCLMNDEYSIVQMEKITHVHKRK